jgi:hypothetical protein
LIYLSKKDEKTKGQKTIENGKWKMRGKNVWAVGSSDVWVRRHSVPCHDTESHAESPKPLFTPQALYINKNANVVHALFPVRGYTDSITNL